MTDEQEFRLNGEMAAIKATLAITLAVLSEDPRGREMVATIKENVLDWASQVRGQMRPHPLTDIGDKATMEALNFMLSGLEP